ncbi:MAG: hypothetical protein R3B70_43385, partial [Polyangiaceae bacterium]
MSRRAAGFDLAKSLGDPGFTPSRRDVPALLELLAEGGAEERELAQRALRRVGEPAIAMAMERAKEAQPEARARLVGLVGRASGAEPSEAARAFLLGALEDAEASVRRRAAGGLGRTRGDAAVAEA